MHTAAVIPVRNRPALIVGAINSVQQQTRPLDEIIVVDDGSTDGTPQIVNRLAMQDSRIHLITLNKSVGASAARNVGINATISDFVCFLDSDDRWMSDKIELQLALLSGNAEAVASFTGIRYEWHGRGYDLVPPLDISLLQLRRMNYLGSTSTAMVRREVLLQVGGFDESLPSCQDWDLWLKLRRVGTFSIVRQPLIVFNQTEESRISKNRSGVLIGHAKMFSNTLADVTDKKERRLISAYHQFRLAQIYFWDFGELTEATILALKSMIRRPTRGSALLLLAIFRKSLRMLFSDSRS